ncbi:hypothetical protein RF11_13218 [Thelohanellus kitauei]|uniref:TFIIS N-terminal domain-containing protein n=1 Tax=Thelohanellus kitauei TaxID=669202 RepID=A0A0C2JHI0_THEKT|nr:hypothetical protein RF11_13218 [Thelohanellus kitauei]
MADRIISSEMFSDLQTIAHSLSELLKVDPTGSSDVRVLELLKKLGEIKMTPKDLKQSQLAKIVNGLRRQTTSATVGAEARSLIKRWRDMVIKKDQSVESTKESLVEVKNYS